MMRKLIPIIALSLALTACNNTVATVATGGSVASANQVAVTNAEKGLIIAHLAYNDIGRSLIAATMTGTLRGMNAATAKVWYDKAGDSLKAADAADAALNAQGITAAIAAAEDAIGQASAIVNPPKK